MAVKKKTGNKIIGAAGKLLGAFNPSDENAQTFMQWIVPRIKVEELKKALSYFSQWQLTGDDKWANLWDPVPGLFQNFAAMQKHEYTVRKFGRKWWPYIEKYVANPAWIIKYISDQNKEVGQMLSTSLGKTYMQYYSQKLHAFFHTWLFLFPRYHTDCGGLILYGLIQREINLWGFYCRHCGARYTAEQIEANSYQGRKYKHAQANT